VPHPRVALMPNGGGVRAMRHDPIPPALAAAHFVAVRDKRPIERGWPERPLSLADAAARIAAGGDVAIKVGAASGNVVDVDLDCPEAVKLADLYLPATGAEFGRPAKPRSHRLYRAAGAVLATFADPLVGDMLVELRADGRDGGAHLTTLPPSITGGERREWSGSTIEPAVIDAAVLARRVAWLAIGCLIMRHVSEYAARRPGPDLAGLLWESDRTLGRAAYKWLGEPAPDEPRRHPKPRGQMSNEELRLAEVVAAIRNDGLDWSEWNRLGLAIYAASGGSEEGFIVFDDLSARCPAKYDPYITRARWRNFHRSPPSRIGVGTLVHLAREAGWRRSAA